MGCVPSSSSQYVLAPGNYELQSNTTWQYSYDAEGNVVTMTGLVTGAAAGQSKTFTYKNENQTQEQDKKRGQGRMALRLP
jgi:hypothetical protein